MGKERLNFLDIGKGIAIFLVVLGHAIQGDNYLCNWIYSFHIPIFLIISGSLLSFKDNWKTMRMKSILIKKIKQILYPYLTFSFIAIVYNLLRCILKQIPFSQLKNNIIVTISLQGIDTLWFLSALFFAEILFIVIYKYTKKKWIYFGVLFILSALGANFLQHNLFDSNGLMLKFCLILNIFVRSIIACLFIEVGYKFYKLQDFILKNSKYTVIISAIVFFSSIYISQINGAVDLHYSKINNFILYYLLSISISISLLILIKYIMKSNRVLEYFGRNSLIIMATHLSLPILKSSQDIVSIFDLPFGVYINGIIISIIVMIIEFAVIEAINRKLKFVIKIK